MKKIADFDEPDFKRGQATHALWNALYPQSGEVPNSFVHLLKRLLEVDRNGGIKRSGYEESPFAFAETAPSGKGNEVRYSPFGVFCIALSLEMTDLGLTPQESIYFIRHVRERLRREFAACLRAPMVPRDGDVDNQRWMVFERIHFHKTFLNAQEKPIGGPLLMEPNFGVGREGLVKLLRSMGHIISYRKAYVQELSRLVLEISARLPNAPEIKRGRK